jgi:hypothetical protein
MTLFCHVKNILKVLKRFKIKSQLLKKMEVNQEMFVVRYERDKNKIEMIFTYAVSLVAPCKEREFRLNRRLDETIGKTFEKMLLSVEKQMTTRKKRKTDTNQSVSNDTPGLVATLYDQGGRMVSLETINNDAWKEDYRFCLNEREYRVVVDLPFVKKIALSKVVLAGMPTLVNVELPSECQDMSFFSWYHSDTDIIPENWYLIDEGVNKRFCLLDKKAENKLIRLKCTPNDGKREGLPIEIQSHTAVKSVFDINELPMSEKHALTSKKMSGYE